VEAASGIDGCLEMLEDHISVVAANTPMSEQGASFQEMCTAFEGLAIFYLLDDLNLTRYHWCLQRSAQARIFFLRKLREQRTRSLFEALSRTNSVFAAIATGDAAVAARIETLSPDVWTPDGEYEDDFWYFRLVHALARGATPEATQHLAAFETALAGDRDARVAVCQTFIEGREEGFWEALSDLADVRREAAAIAPDAGILHHEPWRWAFALVSLELVAWTKLAVRQGFRAPDLEMRGCPSVALLPSPAGPSVEIFLELEKEFNL
jgi:hypothetical protein